MLRIDKIFVAIILASLIIGGFVYLAIKDQPRTLLNNPVSVTDSKPDSLSPKIDECSANNSVVVTKIIDGDTIIVEGGHHVRLLGIDADEKNYSCYEAARIKLEELILNKKVTLQKDITDVDQYGRCLRYVFMDNENVNVQLVKEGQAVASFYPPDVRYKKEIVAAEKSAIENKVGCKWGK